MPGESYLQCHSSLVTQSVRDHAGGSEAAVTARDSAAFPPFWHSLQPCLSSILCFVRAKSSHTAPMKRRVCLADFCDPVILPQDQCFCFSFVSHLLVFLKGCLIEHLLVTCQYFVKAVSLNTSSSKTRRIRHLLIVLNISLNT